MIKGLCIKNLRAQIGEICLFDISANVAPGEILTIMGPSGAGKSTFLAAISGFEQPNVAISGKVLMDGEDLTALPAHRRQIGHLFQDPLLFPHLDVAGNLAFGLEERAQNRRTRIDQALAAIELPGRGRADPASLSGGQQSRVALMRCLLAAPKAVLLDEPFSKLDAELRARIRDMTFAQLRRENLPAILVTHDPSDIPNQGRVIEIGHK